MNAIRAFAIALVHHPVLDRAGAVVTSAVTNIDVHDLSRSARTYGASALYVTTPIEAQRRLVETILGHWTSGSSGDRIPTRRDALGIVRVVATLDDAVSALGGRPSVEIWTTAARTDAGRAPMIGNYEEGRARMRDGDPRTILFVFGTSWGLAPSIVDDSDARLPPIVGPEGAGGYNHLSVRAACAITLDRLVQSS